MPCLRGAAVWRASTLIFGSIACNFIPNNKPCTILAPSVEDLSHAASFGLPGTDGTAHAAGALGH